MSQLPIHFFLEDISFTLKQKGLIRSWVKNTIVEDIEGNFAGITDIQDVAIIE